MLEEFLEMDTPVMFWSAPGCGKSTIFAQTVASKGGAFHVIYPARVDPMTIGGLPKLRDSNVVVSPWKWVDDLNRAAADGRLAVLLLDEINGGDTHQLAAVQSLAENMLGSVRLHPGVRVFAAANPVAVSTGGCELPPPIINRFTHVRWFEEGPYYPAPGFPFVLSRRKWIAWMRERGGGHSLVAMAIEALGLPAAESPDDEKPFASPRSWEMAAKVVSRFGVDHPSVEGLVVGAVGSMGAKAIVWLKDLALPTAEELLAGAEIPPEPDKAAACVEVARAFIEKSGVVDVGACIRLIGRMRDKHPGLGIVLASRIGKKIMASGYKPTREEKAILSRLYGTDSENNRFDA